ncbi:MAG: MFS transporter [Alphaproteobacteria bacterium]|nr:MFS transporter [Alphaproteobacteria bacterium]
MGKSATDAVNWDELLTRRHALSLSSVCLGVWLHAADSLLVATMMPAIVADIGGANLMSWTVALYEIGTIVAGAAGGLLSVRYGLRIPMALAAGTFTFGCITSALAPEMWVLLAGRLIQGLGGGGLMALSFISIGQLFPRRLIARVMAAVSTLWGISAFFGPLAGGLFVEYGTWRGGFWFFGLQAGLLTLWILARIGTRAALSTENKHNRFPVFRLACLSAGVISIAFAGVEISIIRTPGFALAGMAFLALFLRLDGQKEETRLLPKGPIGFREPVSAALTMILCFAMATVAISVYGPLLIAMLHGASALQAGYVIACSSIGWTIAAVLVSGLPERHDQRMILLGMLVLTASIIGFAYTVPRGPVWLIAVFAAMEGSGFGMAWTFILRRVMSLANKNEQERVSGAIPTVQRLGYALGAAYAGIVANAAGLGQHADGTSTNFVATVIFLACLPLAGIGLFATYQFVRTSD